MLAERGAVGADGGPLAAVEWGRAYVQPLLGAMRRARCGEPYPYVAVLVADGDRVGRALEAVTDPEQLRDFSNSLLEFARRARAIVEGEHCGALVYSGGDDVLALVGLPDAIDCAERLRIAFLEAVPAVRGRDGTEHRPTLSVGLGVGHVLEGMGDLLEFGRRAERLAKQSRNSLGVVVVKRGGDELEWTGGWDRDPAGALHRAARALRSQVPRAKLHEIARDLRRFPDECADGAAVPLAADEDKAWADYLRSDVRRTLVRANLGVLADRPDPAELAEIDWPGDGRPYAETRRAVDAWVRRMFCARVFADCPMYGRERIGGCSASS